MVVQQVEVHVPLPYLLHSSDVSKLGCDLFKFILVQCNQIPYQYPQLMQDRNRLSGCTAEVGAEETPLTDSTNLRRILREQKEEKKKNRLIEKYRKKLSAFLDESEAMLGALCTAIEEDIDNILALRFNIGATVLSPKVSCILQLPDTFTHKPNPAFRPGSVLLRALVTNKDLFRLTSEKLPIKNLFTFIEKKSVKSSESVFYPTPGPYTKRGVQIYIRLSYQLKEPERILSTPSEPETDFKRPEETGNRKPVDSSNFFTPVGRRGGRGREVQETYTPVAMDMCTPYQARLEESVSIVSSSSVHHSPDSRKRYLSNELCTPLSSSTNRTSTCATLRKPGSMDLCTPVESKRASLIDLCTPASTRNSEMLDNSDISEKIRQLNLNPPVPDINPGIVDPSDYQADLSSPSSYWVTWPRPIRGFSDLPI